MRVSVRCLWSVLLLITLLSGAAPRARADIVTFTSRAAWEAALGRPADFLEDFEGFAVDTPFRTAPVNFNGFSMVQTGFDADFRNLVEVPPFQFTDNNGTRHASMFVERDLGPTGVLLTFAIPSFAFGADFTGTDGGERIDLILQGGSFPTLQVPDYPPTPGTSGFFGFIATAGESITGIQFVARNIDPGSGGEGFAMDNVTGAAVPEPSAWLLLGLGGVLCAARKWRGRRSTHSPTPV